MRIVMRLLSLAAALAGAASANPLNPDLSVVGVVEGAWTDEVYVTPAFDAGLGEVELSVKADVDPFFTAEAFFAFDATAGAVEQAEVSTLALPAGLKASVGRIRATFGKLNLMHEHVWYTVSPPLTAEALFDEARWIENGARLAWLAPLPFFVEVTGEALRGEDPVWLSGGTAPDWAGNGHLKTFVDLTESWSLETGASGARGPNASMSGAHSLLLGADLALRWRPPASKTRHGITLFAEGVQSRREQPDAAGEAETAVANGGWLMLDVQPAIRWHIAARVDTMRDPLSPDALIRAYAGVVSWSPSEFSNVMLEARSDHAGGTSSTTVSARATFALGPHGAHPF